MIGPINQLPDSVRDAFDLLQKKFNQLANLVNEIERRERARNRRTHINVVKLGDGELLHCNDCDGDEVQLWDATCGERSGLETPL